MIKNILLTGATGFIGSHLLEALVDNGNKVIITKISGSDTTRIDHLLKKVKSYDSDKVDLEKMFVETKIDCVIHLATNYIKSHKSKEEVELMLDSNIKFPSILAELCIKHKVGSFINTGTFFEYKMKDSPIKEGDPIDPYNFYASTKVAFDNIIKFYSKCSGLKVMDFKLFAPFGEKDNEKLVVFLTKSLLTGKRIEFSGGEQTWNFTYVKDIVQAYIKGIEKIENIQDYESFNVGYEKTHSIRELAGMLEKISGKKFDIAWGAKPYVENEIFYVSCKNTKIKSGLGWKPQFDLYTGLKVVYDYYRLNT